VHCWYRAEDKSVRYVAEENIERLYDKPCESLMNLAGRWFKRWDRDTRVFVSNITDEYPDD
jgi:F-box protein 21